MPNTLKDTIPNHLLAHLPPDDRDHLVGLSRPERPAQGLILRGAGVQMDEVWFPHTGVVALTTTDELGRTVQTGLVGREGCIGAEALFEAAPAPSDAVVQIEGAFSVVPAARLADALKRRPAIRKVLLGFLYGLSIQSIRTIACNRMHSLRARCCRWLLTMQDRTASAELRVTQESLALLLGSGRPRVNQLLGDMEDQSLIRRHRGRVRIVDRIALARMACDCYRIVSETVSLIARSDRSTGLSHE